jgi:16S rRNA (guanine527-N7)-methyltransferase
MTTHPSPDQDAQLEALAALIADSPHNLVSRRARSELASRHIPESAQLASLIPALEGPLLDVGSGGGLPGLVIAIVRPELEVHLLEATGKKVEFLHTAAAELGVPVTVHHGRAEELARGSLAGSFQAVTARAVAPLTDLVGLTLPFLAPGGAVYAVKGERWREELDAAAPALRAAGGAVLATPDEMLGGPDAAENGPRVVMLGRSR